jgi:L-ascorbate metabolism protein UlaG (beta-lactamase superfamily)
MVKGKLRAVVLVMALALMASACSAEDKGKNGRKAVFEEDRIKTAAGELKITFIGHGTLMLTFNNKVIHIDPTMREADYAKMPKADLILITHHHGDHMDPAAIAKIRTKDTQIVLTRMCAKKVKGGTAMANGDSRKIGAITIAAVPAYNLIHMRKPGQPFHPKGEGNGYVLTIGGKRIYIAGDTENTPEMKALKEIDIAFLPMNLPYTMTPAMVADAAKAFRPKILYPYHFGKTNPQELVKLLKDEKDIKVRVRKME